MGLYINTAVYTEPSLHSKQLWFIKPTSHSQSQKTLDASPAPLPPAPGYCYMGRTARGEKEELVWMNIAILVTSCWKFEFSSDFTRKIIIYISEMYPQMNKYFQLNRHQIKCPFAQSTVINKLMTERRVGSPCTPLCTCPSCRQSPW